MPSLPFESGTANRKLILPPQPFWHLASSRYLCRRTRTMCTTLPARAPHYVTDPSPKREHEKWIVDGAFRVRRAGKNKSKLTDADGAIDVIAVRAPVRSPFCSLVRDWDRDRNVERRKTQGGERERASERGRESLPKDDFPKTPAAFRGREEKSHKKAPVALCVDTL